MDAKYHLEIHFYNEYQASVLVQTSASDQERELGEVVLFNCLALRQMHNLQTAGIPLAHILSAVGADLTRHWNYAIVLQKIRSMEEIAIYMPLVAALGVEVTDLLPSITPLAVARAASGHDDKAIAAELWPNVPQVVERRISPGKKRFVADMDLRGAKVEFVLNPKGFGIFGKGVNYFAPLSVVILLRHLVDQPHKKLGYEGHITRSANLCGKNFMSGKVTQISQLKQPIEFAHQTKEYKGSL